MLAIAGIALALVILWSEPKWAILAVCVLIAAVVLGGPVWMSAGLYTESITGAQPFDEAAQQWLANAVASAILLAVLIVPGVLIVLFRGPYLRAKKKREDAETEAELARIRQSHQ